MSYNVLFGSKYSIIFLVFLVTIVLALYNLNINKLSDTLLQNLSSQLSKNESGKVFEILLADQVTATLHSTTTPTKRLPEQNFEVVSDILRHYEPNEDFNCTFPGLSGLNSKYYRSQYGKCQPHVISDEACKFVKTIYKRNYKNKKCGIDRVIQLCEYEFQKGKIRFKCDIKNCFRYNKSFVRLKAFEESSQKLVILGSYNSSETVTNAVVQYAFTAIENDNNFLFLECFNHNENVKPYAVPTQFLKFPPRFFMKDQASPSKAGHSQDNININILLLDSVARAHFFRSLPKTIHTMNVINSKTSDEVLDFELFQAVHGHTTDNLRALFSGAPYHGKENDGVNIRNLYGTFSSKGYSTVYQDDLCYEGWWGVRMDLGSPDTWKQFLEKKKKNFIDSTGLIFANCHIYKANNVSDPFNGPEGPWCFNGKFHDEHYLDYTYNIHKYAQENTQNIITFTGLNMGHDDTGRRIQGFDHVLSNYINRIRNATNTLTMLFADHGNTYTHFTHAIMEGRFEQYHPSLFLIIPKKIQMILGKKVMKHLRENQKKLVTLIDVFEALNKVPKKVEPTGIFGTIPNNRTCDDVPLILPNLCVCDGWDAETKNNTRQVGFLDFAVGELNNKIIATHHKKANTTKQKCHMLIPTQFRNVRERNMKSKLITSMTFYVKPGVGSQNNHDAFHVEIESVIDPQKSSREMRLISFDRISMYGPYRKCADVDVKLCVCDMPDALVAHTIQSLKRNISRHHNLFHTVIDITPIPAYEQCLKLKSVSYPEDPKKPKDILSDSLYISNNCTNKFRVVLETEVDNMKTSSAGHFDTFVIPQEITYVGSILRDVPYWSSKVEKIKFVNITRIKD